MYQQAIKHYLEKHGFERFAPKAVLFDMDGVLFDSMPNHAIAWREAMDYYGIAMTSEDAYATEGQRGVDTIRQMALRQNGQEISEEKAQEMYEEKSRRFHLMPDPPVMEGALELMGKIRQSGLTIGVVTGSAQPKLIGRMLNVFGEYVDESHIVTAKDVKLGKPHPDPYLQGLAKAGELKPWEAIVVENAPLGVEAAVAARILTICVNTGHLPTEIFQEKGADIILDSMATLDRLWPSLPV